MTCSRCSGFMLEDHLLDLKGSYGEVWARGWRCVNCGHAHDAVTQRNRLARETQILGVSPGKPGYQDKEFLLGVESFHRFTA
jgi:hypothetical protein